MAKKNKNTPEQQEDLNKNEELRKKKTLWTNDGTEDTPSSMDMLLDWLTTDGNYSRWKGSDTKKGHLFLNIGLKGGIKKEVLCTEICNALKAVGIDYRVNADIRPKISTIEQGFRKASDWLANTG